MAGRRAFLVGGAGLALGGCWDTPCYERNAKQKAFVDGLQALAKPALASNNPLRIEEAAKQSVALADKVGAFADWCGTLKTIEGNAETVAVTIEVGPQISLYAFNDWKLAMTGSAATMIADLFSTRSREAPPPGLSDGRHRSAKNLPARRARETRRAHGRDRGLGPVRSLPSIRQGRGGEPPVPAVAALRGSHQVAGGVDVRMERIWGAVFLLRFSLHHQETADLRQ